MSFKESNCSIKNLKHLKCFMYLQYLVESTDRLLAIVISHFQIMN